MRLRCIPHQKIEAKAGVRLELGCDFYSGEYDTRCNCCGGYWQNSTCTCTFPPGGALLNHVSLCAQVCSGSRRAARSAARTSDTSSTTDPNRPKSATASTLPPSTSKGTRPCSDACCRGNGCARGHSNGLSGVQGQNNATAKTTATRLRGPGTTTGWGEFTRWSCAPCVQLCTMYATSSAAPGL